MMDKKQILKWFHEIQNGSGIAKGGQDLPENFPRGSEAIRLWNEIEFGYGMEYGILWALWHVFNLNLEDLK